MSNSEEMADDLSKFTENMSPMEGRALSELNFDIAEGNKLRSKFIALSEEYEAQVVEQDSIKRHLEIIKELEEYEKTLSCFEPLYYIYHTMAMAYLNIGNYKKAYSYGKAFYSCQEARNDVEGIFHASGFMSSFYISTHNFKKAVSEMEIFSKRDETAEPMRKRLEEDMNRYKELSDSEPLFKLPKTARFPSTYKYLMNECTNEEKLEEKTIRSLMRAMHTGRSTALQYVNLAKKNRKQSKD